MEQLPAHNALPVTPENLPGITAGKIAGAALNIAAVGGLAVIMGTGLLTMINGRPSGLLKKKG